MATEETKSKTAYFEGLDLGELNRLNRDITKSRLEGNMSAVNILSNIFSDVYKFDIKKGSGPYAAVVLEVLTGPQAGNEASTNGRLNTKSLNLDVFPDPLLRSRKLANKPPPVTVIAKIPEFDSDIGWPESDKDKARIDAHGEFRQISEELEHVNKIEVGSVIWIQYYNDDVQSSYDGGPTGMIIGVHTIEAHADIATRISAKKAQSPECQAARNLTAPAGGFYVGHTDDNPVPTVPSIKIKGHIKTGFFGAGHPRTKVHFDSALAEAPISPKYQIPGPAPGSNNAFIWIGTLKNNGYMDLLDRPIGQGRETIIYAPMTLDLNAPVEIKYYLHGAGGFGAAHINGPYMLLEHAVLAGKMNGNDFNEKIAPAIKDLNRDGRNYILVIPEMSYSRGFGTANDDVNRINLLIEERSIGTGVYPDNTAKTTVRTAATPEARSALKNYLNTIPIEANKNLVQNIPLRERQLSTFDGSYTGGDFGLFHDEVMGVLDEHLYAANFKADGTIYGLIEFVSILADGLGGIALASIVKNVPNSATHADAATNFKIWMITPETPLRIDYITDSVLDSGPNFYSSFFGTDSPSSVILKNLLQVRSQDFYTEFNYITSPSTKTTNNFFDNLGKIEDYKKHSKSGAGLGTNKFSFLLGNSVEDQRFVSLHVCPKNRVGYAFSMVNDFLSSFKDYPKKPNVNSSLRPSFDAVPDHAYALVTKPSPGDLEKLKKKQLELLGPIKYFSELVKIISEPFAQGSGLGEGFFEACKDTEEGKPSPYKIYCNNGIIDQSPEGKFSTDYRKYLKNERELAEIDLLIEGEAIILKLIGFKKQLEDQIGIYETARDAAIKERDENPPEEPIIEKWHIIHTFLEYTRTAALGKFDPNFYNIPTLAGLVAPPEAYKKILTKIESAIKAIQPQTAQKSADCAPSPEALAKLTGTAAKTAKSSVSGNNCSEIKLLTGTPPSTFLQLSQMINYTPKQTDFEPFNGRASKQKTKVHLTPGFKTTTFKYPSRGAKGEITFKKSPLIWACIADHISDIWKEVCEETKYYPFEIINGAKGLQEPKTSGVAAYEKGLSLHALGLAIDIDPQITGYSPNGRPLNSVYTGAWTSDFVSIHGETLYGLGVYKRDPLKPDRLLNNAFQEPNRRRLAENWREAPDHYKGSGEDGNERPKYGSIMKAAKGSPIVPAGANPTLWMILFCEKTGMRWGNGLFLKKRHYGGTTWSKPEQDQISRIFQIPDIVKRVQDISWNSDIDNHMHLQYWGGGSIIPWKQIDKVREGKK